MQAKSHSAAAEVTCRHLGGFRVWANMLFSLLAGLDRGSQTIPNLLGTTVQQLRGRDWVRQPVWARPPPPADDGASQHGSLAPLAPPVRMCLPPVLSVDEMGG